ncbi:MAG: hypothetical protein IPK13_01845 [Deltaproteobacteria bacterium]|nr:hypothetical protein [Deltaproteobacteria bacterium]
MRMRISTAISAVTGVVAGVVTGVVMGVVMGGFAAVPRIARAEQGPTVKVAVAAEREVPWTTIEAVFGKKSSRPAHRTPSPTTYTVENVLVQGTIDEAKAELSLEAEVHVLERGWVMVPLLPGTFSVSKAEMQAMDGSGSSRVALVRRDGKVALLMGAAGRYRVRLRAEGALVTERASLRLRLLEGVVSSGRASFEVRSGRLLEGRTQWHIEPCGSGCSGGSDVSGVSGALGVSGNSRNRATAVLGAEGVDLVLKPPARDEPEPAAVDAALEDLQALSVITLGGRGLTIVRVTSTPNKQGVIDVELPAGARVWKVLVGKSQKALESVASGARLRIPIDRHQAARLEIAYTFDAPRMGLRGRFHVDLPRFPVAIRRAEWMVGLPSGLSYEDVQASIATSVRCRAATDPGQELAQFSDALAQSVVYCFESPMLDPSTNYFEGRFVQAL